LTSSQWTRQKQQHQEHDDDCGDLRKLAVAAGAVNHLGLGRAAVDDKGSGQSRSEVGKGGERDPGDYLRRHLCAFDGQHALKDW
jgi:hypothetical protein